MTSTSGMREALEADLLQFFKRKYVLRADARQQSMGVSYLEAEVHDLAKEVARHVAALSAVPAPLSEMENHVANSLANQAESVPQRLPNLDDVLSLCSIATIVAEDDNVTPDELQALRLDAIRVRGQTIRALNAKAVEEITSRLPREEQRSSPQWRPDPRTVALAIQAAATAEPDVESEAAAENEFQEGYVVGFMDCQARCVAAIRSLNSQTSALKND